jgi:hypothetical protein
VTGCGGRVRAGGGSAAGRTAAGVCLCCVRASIFLFCCCVSISSRSSWKRCHVSIRSAYVQHTSAYVSIRSAYVLLLRLNVFEELLDALPRQHTFSIRSAYVQHTFSIRSAYVQHTFSIRSAYVSIRHISSRSPWTLCYAFIEPS